MKEHYQLSLTKREVDQLLKEMAMAENTKEKQTNTFWERHEVVIEKLIDVIYDAHGKKLHQKEENI